MQKYPKNHIFDTVFMKKITFSEQKCTKYNVKLGGSWRMPTTYMELGISER